MQSVFKDFISPYLEENGLMVNNEEIGLYKQIIDNHPWKFRIGLKCRSFAIGTKHKFIPQLNFFIDVSTSSIMKVSSDFLFEGFLEPIPTLINLTLAYYLLHFPSIDKMEMPIIQFCENKIIIASIEQINPFIRTMRKIYQWEDKLEDLFQNLNQHDFKELPVDEDKIKSLYSLAQAYNTPE